MFSLPENRPALMGILNVTPDSFSDGGQHFSLSDAVDAGWRMIEDGADLIDVGGESTRPGSKPVELVEEIQRTIPVIEDLVRIGVPVSIDTRTPEVARSAIRAGAFLVNDVS
ncbi:MAG: dihydropteroate synthase, partial [Fimbriimonadaceae bacterium]|nr:dihydropteroate synthase [Fimbriimonadaceae bacterium]